MAGGSEIERLIQLLAKLPGLLISMKQGGGEGFGEVQSHGGMIAEMREIRKPEARNQNDELNPND